MNQAISSSDGLLIGAGDRTARLDKLGPLGLLLGLGGGVASLILYFSGYGAAMAGSWVFAWYFWLSITLGMFALSILNHAIRPTWSLALLRIFEAGSSPLTFGMMFLLFVPIIVHPAVVYPWAFPGVSDPTGVIAHKLPYLNPTAWTIRLAIWFGLWALFSGFMRKSVRRQEANGDFRLESGRSSWGAFGIVFFMLTATFAIIDVNMSLEPKWYSTMHGLWQIIGSALGAMSLAVVIACVNAKRDPYNSIITPNLTKDWGNLLFCLTMLWAYTAISQFLIIWNGNLPDTAQYYARRSQLMWNAIGMVTILGQFLVPWMTLLSPRVKRYPQYLCQIAGWIFCIHIVDAYLAVGPGLPVLGQPIGEFHRAAGQYLPLDVIAFLTMAGFWLFMFAQQIKTAPLLVSYDHRLQEAASHAH